MFPVFLKVEKLWDKSLVQENRPIVLEMFEIEKSNLVKTNDIVWLIHPVRRTFCVDVLFTEKTCFGADGRYQTAIFREKCV